MTAPLPSEFDCLVADESGLSVAAVVAGEDLRVGDDVAILHETLEVPSCFWSCDASTLSPHELVRLKYASRDPGVPLRVAAICLPFVFLETPQEKHRTVDLRMVQLVRLAAGYARTVRKSLKKERA